MDNSDSLSENEETSHDTTGIIAFNNGPIEEACLHYMSSGLVSQPAAAIQDDPRFLCFNFLVVRLVALTGRADRGGEVEEKHIHYFNLLLRME